jgi:nickel-dependent lactate racemase
LAVSTSGPVDVIVPRKLKGNLDPSRYVENALQNPLDIDPGMFLNVKSVAIGINDKTRPVPHEHLLPPLLALLQKNGVARENIHLIIANGIHQPMSEDEYTQILPQEIVDTFPISSHDCDHSPLVDLGFTSRGTPVLINRDFCNAELRITVGNIETHHFMGYSGGAKTAAIGLAGRTTITHNHAFITHPNAVSGHYEDNPMRQDVEEIGRMIGLQFSLNAILNSDKEIVQVIAGDPLSVMASGVPLSRRLNEVPVKTLYDLVIVSPGGYPKDINFYQSQKAMTHAGLITREGGDILLIAECIDGIGNTGYEKVMHNVSSHAEAIRYFKEHEFAVGPHKAYLVARDGVNKNLLIHSSLSAEQVNRLLLKPVNDPQEFLDRYFSNVSRPVKVAILPHGTTTIPHLDA